MNTESVPPQEFITLYNSIVEFHNKKNLFAISIKEDARRKELIHNDYMRNFHTFEVVKILIENQNIEEIYYLARGMFERMINMGVLSSRIYEKTKDDDVGLYEDFSVLEIKRLYNQITELGYSVFKVKEQINEFLEKCEKKKKEFVSKYPSFKIKNINQGWSGDSIRDRIKKLDRKCKGIFKYNNYFELLYLVFYKLACNLMHPSNIGFLSLYNEEIKLSENNTLEEKKVTIRKEQIISAGRYTNIIIFISLYFFGKVLNDDEIIDYSLKNIAGFNKFMELT